MELAVLIVGAGPAGLATAACLSKHSIPYLILEQEDCSASLWRTRTYDCVKLHLAKEFCALPYMPYPSHTPTYVPREEFLQYLDRYIEHFDIQPRFCTTVESAAYDMGSKRWAVAARDTVSGAEMHYAAKYLVVATGENGMGRVPTIPGLQTFPGEAVHSSMYKSAGRGYVGQKVLVVGSGNSGMEIAYDLASHGADTSIVVRSPVHIVSKESLRMGMNLVKYMPVTIVDDLIVMKDNILFGDLSSHGIVRPKMGPLLLKSKTGRSSVIDVGTVELIKKEVIKVCRGISKIVGNKVTFQGGKESSFDAIVFATGYKSTANNWLKDNKRMLNDDGFPKKGYPNHWKGENGVYFAGFARRGLAGIAMDAKNIASDIVSFADPTSV